MPIWLDADHTRLAQVVANLLNNAAKYTPSGGTVSLSAHVHGGMAEIKVTDTGVGIPSEMQPRIFEIFAQVEDHLAKAQGGLGIGLALVKQLVALHGGDDQLQRRVELASANRARTWAATFTAVMVALVAPLVADVTPSGPTLPEPRVEARLHLVAILWI
jgi:signal transduction histidine kinase